MDGGRIRGLTNGVGIVKKCNIIKLAISHCWNVSEIQWKLDLVDTDLAENLDLEDTHQKI